MDAAHDARADRAPTARWAHDERAMSAAWRAAVELWLLPALVAALPYRLGIALARGLARTLPLYDDAARAGLAQWRTVAGSGNDDGQGRAWLTDYRFAQLVDHADLFWALTRSRRFLLRRVGAAPAALFPGRALLVLSFHFGQGLWLLHWLAAQGRPPRFVSIRLDRAQSPSALHFAYARLRMAAVGRVSGVAPIYTGGARREIAQTLAGGGTVYGLVDVPVPDAQGAAGNATLLGKPVLLPPGLLEAAHGASAQALVLTARAGRDGRRIVETEPVGDVDEVTIGGLAALLERRLREAPAAWHFWHLWPQFRVKPPS